MLKIYVCSCHRYLYRPPYNVVVCPLCQHNGLDPYTKCSKLDYFYYFPLIPYLKKFWKDFPAWAKACHYPWEEHTQTAGKMCDFYDSPNWKKHECLKTGRRHASNSGNMGFVLNTDGMQFFKSTSSSLWPVWLMNANLPPKIR